MLTLNGCKAAFRLGLLFVAPVLKICNI